MPTDSDNGIDVETYDEPRWPTWLKAVAARVDELLADAFVSGRFLAKLWEWATELANKGPTGGSPDEFHIHHNREVKILPIRHTSVAEKYAALAAIHHEVADDADQPRKIESGDILDASSDSERLVCVSYEILCSQVSELGDQGERVERALKEVEQDLREAGWRGEPNEDKTEAGDTTPIGASAGEQPARNDSSNARPSAEPGPEMGDLGAGDPWPPVGNVAVSTITHGAKYKKNGKNPARTTIQQWEKRESVAKAYHPQSNEVAYPQEWVSRHWNKWSPRQPQRNTPT